VPVLAVYNKCDVVEADEIRRLRHRDPAGVFLSARTGAGVDALLAAMAAHLALDAVRLTLSFQADDEDDRQRISRVYRFGRVLAHEVQNGRVAIVADVPRRMADQFAPSAR
jgi:GTP-binding protein HflX